MIAFSEGVSESMCIITGNITEANSEISIYPNPTNDRLFWNSESEWKLLDIHGKEVAKGKGNSTDMSKFPKGMYFLQLDETAIKVFKK